MKLRGTAFATFAFATILVLVLAPIGAIAQAGGSATGALSPDTAEIESVGASSVVFINYEGPEPRIDSLADIKGLGLALGREIPAGGAATRAGAAARYQVIRAVDPSVKVGLDADILILGPDAQVDHVRNLRWIIAGYLVAAWGYAEKDAYTLATFITVYDAVHRGDMKYFASKYKAVVQKELAPETAGLALSYTEWPGKSRIVVPLSSGAAAGKLGAVDTGAVSDKAVTESLKAQPDKGVPDRQALVDVKEREAAQKQAELDKQKADLAAAEKKLADDKAKAEADRAALEAAKATAASTNAPATAAPATTTAAPGAAACRERAAPAAELATKEAAVKAEEAAVASGTAAVAAKKAEVASGEAAVASKQAEAAAERKDITADQKAVIAAEVASKGAAAAAGVYLVRVGDDPSHLGQIVFVDPDKGATIRSSRINDDTPALAHRAAGLLPRRSRRRGQAGRRQAGQARQGQPRVGRREQVRHVPRERPPRLRRLGLLGRHGRGRLVLLGEARRRRPRRAGPVQGRRRALALPRQASGNIAAPVAPGSFFLLKPDTLEKVKELK